MNLLASIVVGTDFSPCSAVAIEQALRIGAKFRSKVFAVHVVDTVVVIEVERRTTAFQAAIREGLIRDAKAAWSKFASGIPGAADLGVSVEVNNRVAGLLQHAADVHAELIVLGAFGEHPPVVGLGTVASGCVRDAACDVLLVRDTKRGPFTSIVACVDFSDTSLRALEIAARLAVADDAKLHVLHVYQGPTNLFPFLSSVVDVMNDANAQIKAEATQRVAQMIDTALKNAGAECASLKPSVHINDAAGHGRGIVDFVTQHGADLIVLGTRGQTNLRDVLLGSTAERVLRSAPCSILAIKPPS